MLLKILLKAFVAGYIGVIIGLLLSGEILAALVVGFIGGLGFLIAGNDKI